MPQLSPSPELQQTLQSCFQTAGEMRHEYVSVEHLVLCLLKDKDAAEVLRVCGADIEQLRAKLQDFITRHHRVLDADIQYDLRPSMGVQRILSRAAMHTQGAGRVSFNGAEVLAAVFHEEDNHSVYLLREQGIERVKVTSYIAHGNRRDTRRSADPDSTRSEVAEGESGPLEKYTRDLCQAARDGALDPLIGREAELLRIEQVLCRRNKSSPLLVGEVGIGKTAIAEGLASRIVAGEATAALADSTVYSLDMGALLAGTRYRGDFEERFKELSEALRTSKNSILFIDEIHTVIGAGSASGGFMDASNLLKPMLSGGLRCIGATTFREFRAIFERDHALARRFQKIQIEAPDSGHSLKILKGLKSHFEQHHALQYTDSALRAAVDLSERYLTDRSLPDKAIDVIDEAGAWVRLGPKSRRRRVGVRDIESVISQMAGVPTRIVGGSERHKLQHLATQLKLSIFGQDRAIAALVSAIKLARTGLKSREKTMGSFLLSGPTGVGKTELCRQLARQLGVELMRFDMSEYMERHTVSRLIGAPPGYVGHERDGLLTAAVSKNPAGVLLLDEIEKAHAEVFNLLLQVMDHGKLTDSNGRQADFRNLILVMTTNAGAIDAARPSVGFTEQSHLEEPDRAIERLFSPEFRNRLDAVVRFVPLSPAVITSVVEKFLAELQARLDERMITLDVDETARAWLAERGYDPTMGARPMERLIREQIATPLAEQLVELPPGQARVAQLRVSADRRDLVLLLRSSADDDSVTDASLHRPTEAIE